MGEPSLGTPQSQSEDRLDSWKEIAAYLKRDVTTVQRWEKREGMPVHRHLHDRMGSVYASRAELDAWTRSRNLSAAQENGNVALPQPPAPPPPPETRTFLSRRTLALSAGSGGGRAGDWGKPLAVQDGILLAKPHRGRTISNGHGLRWIGAGRCDLTRWSSGRVSVGPGRTHRRLGYPGRFGRVPQPDPRECSGARQSIDPNPGVLARWTLSSPFGFAGPTARAAATLASGRCLPWAASRGHTLKAWPSLTGRTTAPGSRTTLPAPETRCSSRTAAGDRRIGPSSPRHPGSTATFPCGRPTAHSFTSSRAASRTNWISGVSVQPGDPLSESQSHMGRVSHPVLLDRRTLLYLAGDPGWFRAVAL